ncbi:uncharacterized protein NPIL_39781 [Nephila pilipes]|uniref:Uncharacterized protein n=1 Tax=Nephila pilipes TaxID=299642 RepID=A0A8X6TTE9_NEPPI|nr:uncharacterized protein NPIL_39781 [Nephila pilipes]
MSFLGKGKKADLIKLANELDEFESYGEELKIIELRAKVLASNAYKEDPEFVKDIFEGIVSNRIDEEREQKEQTLCEFELQKIRLQNETQRVVGSQILPSGPTRHVKASETLNDGRQVSSRKPERLPEREYSHEVPIERSPLKCYGCWKQGVIKSRSPTCNPNSSQRTHVATIHINAYTAQTRSPRLTLIDITFSGKKGRVCADTGSSHSIALLTSIRLAKNWTPRP